ncbi:DUF1223 domain-containing protein [Pseudooceanicola sp. CBS1P-1]|uniref:DUF1223 domain-containing protein n=2 Tax=Paracoccaceae TaxID=31989 RepID=A0A6L7FZF8_9RHOB|nr:DUF1223 domain-containing protein [Pseudooceanicola endophyticus]MXN16812.1 DUF1223 domain-containing protein [Pseudooceanicola albus]
MARQAAARGAGSAHSPVVVELYTSQGCSACPPADKLMEQLAGRDDVLPLALHVDYWDYLGWKDDFADPGFTARQKAYASAHGKRMIYTPQMVVDGTTFVKGARPMALAENIARAMTLPQHYSLSVRKLDNGHYEVQAQALGQDRPKGGLVLELVHYMPRQQVKILRGENAGTELQYVNVVTYWKTLTDWDGTQPLKIEVTPQKDMPGAVLLQRDGMGAIEAAARLR